MIKKKEKSVKGLSEEEMKNSLKYLLFLPLTIFGTLLLSTLIDLFWAWPLKYAWNKVMPQIFNLPTITYWQSFLLLVILCSLWKIVPVVKK